MPPKKELKEVAYVMSKLRGLTPVRVFVSFDYDHDEDLKTLLIGQTKNEDSPFIVTGWSLEEASSHWEEEARARIMRADQVIVLCGKHTDAAIGVNAEIAIARNENKPYFLLAGRAIGGNQKPTAALAADKLYNWTWDNLKKLIGGAR
ncbi:MAG: TIR domain-containing protein [Candidatus Dormibacteraceae bacterium]